MNMGKCFSLVWFSTTYGISSAIHTLKERKFQIDMKLMDNGYKRISEQQIDVNGCYVRLTDSCLYKVTSSLV